MEKYLQDRAWSMLPCKYREEVKRLYDEFKDVSDRYKDVPCLSDADRRSSDRNIGHLAAMRAVFGEHNLTADTEGEEICKNQKTYPKKKMNTELQNKVWSILPKEFKEEVNEIYLNAVVRHPCGYNHKTDLLKYLFGHHNLTSEEEPERLCKSMKDFHSVEQSDRLHIAAMLAQSFVSEMYLAPRDIPRIVTASLGVADALIAAVKGGGTDD